VDDPLEEPLRARLEGDHHAPDRTVAYVSWTWRAYRGEERIPSAVSCRRERIFKSCRRRGPSSSDARSSTFRWRRLPARPRRRGRAAAESGSRGGEPRVLPAPVLEEPADPLPDARRLPDPQQLRRGEGGALGRLPTSSRISFTSSSGRAPSCRSIRRRRGSPRATRGWNRGRSRSERRAQVAPRLRGGVGRQPGRDLPHSSADKAASQGDAYNVVLLPFGGTARLHYNRIV